jgi:hypothetical protein
MCTNSRKETHTLVSIMWKMVDLQDEFNNMWGEGKGIQRRYCNYSYDVCGSNIVGVCVVGYTTFYGLTNMWTSILCLISNSTFHDLKCLKGKCDHCGIDMLITCPNKEDKRSEKIVSRKCYEKMIHGKTRASLDNMVLKLQYKEITTQVFLSYSRPRLHKFVTQNFVACFQEN